jgi:hypothetical protein
MEENDRISGEQGSIKPEATLTEIVRKVAYNRETNDSAPMRAAANGALIRWLKEMEATDIEEDKRVLQFALEQQGFDSVNELVDALFDAGEPVMAAKRQDLAELDVDPDELNLDDEDVGFSLTEADEDG